MSGIFSLFSLQVLDIQDLKVLYTLVFLELSIFGWFQTQFIKQESRIVLTLLHRFNRYKYTEVCTHLQRRTFCDLNSFIHMGGIFYSFLRILFKNVLQRVGITMIIHSCINYSGWDLYRFFFMELYFILFFTTKQTLTFGCIKWTPYFEST